MANPKPSPGRPQGRVFDVRRPGKAPANPSSRPVVIGHKPSAQKAQIAVSGVGEKDPKKDQLLNAKQKIEIRPGDEKNTETNQSATPSKPPKSTDAEAEALAVVAMDGATEQPAANEPDEPDEVTPAKKPIFPAKKPESAKPEAAPEQRGAGTETAPATWAEPPTEQADTFAEPPEATEPTTDEIPLPTLPSETPEVFVSHHASASTGSWKIICLLVVIVLLALFALNIMLDAELLDWSAPHTDFLSD